MHFDEIIYFSDFTPEATAAAPYAAFFGKEFHVPIEVCQLLPVVAKSNERLRNELADEYCKSMKTVLGGEDSDWYLPSFHLERGMESDQIIERAQSRDAGLIVLGIKTAVTPRSSSSYQLRLSPPRRSNLSRTFHKHRVSADTIENDPHERLVFSFLLFVTSIAAGLLGALTGFRRWRGDRSRLALLFRVDIRYAIGASIVSVIATSSGAAVAYVREGLSNIRIGMFLEVATTLGALLGAYLNGEDFWALDRYHLRGCPLIFVYLSSFRKWPEPGLVEEGDSLATRLELTGTYPRPKAISYTAHNVPLGFGIMFGAGTLSGLLGIGSGAVKVLAMDQAMKLPFKVSTTTSNFMIGVTAAASAGIYMARGYIDPGIAFPVMLGVLAGSLLGTRILVRARVGALKKLFAFVLIVLGCEMIYSGMTGRI